MTKSTASGGRGDLLGVRAADDALEREPGDLSPSPPKAGGRSRWVLTACLPLRICFFVHLI